MCCLTDCTGATRDTRRLPASLSRPAHQAIAASGVKISDHAMTTTMATTMRPRDTIYRTSFRATLGYRPHRRFSRSHHQVLHPHTCQHVVATASTTFAARSRTFSLNRSFSSRAPAWRQQRPADASQPYSTRARETEQRREPYKCEREERRKREKIENTNAERSDATAARASIHRRTLIVRTRRVDARSFSMDLHIL